MAALMNALDNYTPTQSGEKGHVEYGWSNSIQEQINQFSFQITRADPQQVHKLSKILAGLLTQLKHSYQTSVDLSIKASAKEYLHILYKMIGQTRDIVDGKGEYTLGYMMIYTWYKFFPPLALFALKCFVTIDGDNKHIHPYGSWKDLKYFCGYCKSKGETVDSEIVQYAILLMNRQLRSDYDSYLCNDATDISLVAKWIPREKSSFKWLYEALAANYFKEFLGTARTEQQLTKALLKCKTEYRKRIAVLNRCIDTLQIKQCQQNWSSIDFAKVTSISLFKQKKAFLNIKKNGDDRFPENNDRINCAIHFKNHIQKAVDGEVEMKGKRIGMESFTRQAAKLTAQDTHEVALLNSQWRDNASQTGSLGKMIAMVDVSSSMDGDPMNVAIALGIRVAEKSVLGNRVLTFHHNPSWVNLESTPDFVSKVHLLKDADWGGTTNFHKALDMILDAIVRNKLSAEDAQDMVLVIFSDMQMDQGDHCDKNALYQTMEKKYAVAGIQINGTPYKPPHILFWNLRSTDGFPSLSTQANTSMMSGFNPSLLNSFCSEGFESLKQCTPWSLLLKSLENERYKVMTDKFHYFFDNQSSLVSPS